MSIRSLRIGVAAVSLSAWVTGVAGVNAWHVLGKASVRIGSDHVTISVPPGKGDVSALKLQVRGSVLGLRIEKLRVHFRSGSVQEIELGDVIPGGTESRTVDLVARGVSGVEVDYESKVVSSTSPRIGKLTLVGRN